MNAANNEHRSFIKTPKQLVIVVALAFAVPIALIVLVSQLITGIRPAGSGDYESQVLSRIQPVGQVTLADASAPAGNKTGEQVFQAVCRACHEAGLAGAPKMGDKAAWAPAIKRGYATLVQHAINGFQEPGKVMPPKGGTADLTDTEVGRAVVYMANQAGANWKEPAAPAAATTAAAAPPAAAPPPSAPPPPAPAAGAPAPAIAGAKADGKKIYDTTCVACHGPGIAGAPKFGDKSAWTARIAEGNNTLYTHAIQGFQGKGGVMPPKGGNTTLADADVKAAVDYMVSAAK